MRRISMSDQPTIAIFTHAIDNFENGGYLLNRLIDHWNDRGFEIVALRGPDVSLPQADLAISHIDMTRVGDEYARLFEHYPLVINGKVRDISKSTFSQQIVTRETPYQGPVIIKTDKNFGGMRELKARIDGGDPSAAIDIQRPWRKVEYLSSYPAFDSPWQVPTGVWRNPELVVEKFRPERNENGEFVLRVWIFFGDRGIYYQCISEEPIIKSHNTIRRQDLDVTSIPPELAEIRAQLGFDYGKFDFGLTDGELVLYDVNRTPGSSRGGTSTPRAEENILNLSKGLDCFMPGNQVPGKNVT
jgi:hypothetical protein